MKYIETMESWPSQEVKYVWPKMVCLQVFRRSLGSFEIAATVHCTPNTPQKNAFLFTCLEPQKLKNLQTFYKLQIALHKHLELKSTAQVKIKRFSILLSALKAALKNETAWELGLKSSCEQVSNKILTYTYLSNQF